MSVHISSERKFSGFETITLENELLRIIILPELGAKIWEIVYKPRERQFLWHNPKSRLEKVPFGAIYDDVFLGGWDELYPNDVPEEINGQRLPDHGEVWSLPWEYSVEKATDREATIYLWVDTPITSSRLEKRITLRADEAILRFHHRLTNLSRTDQPFLWKLHPALVISEYCRVELPARRMFIENFGCPRGGRVNIVYDWPFLTDNVGNSYDMRQVLPDSANISEFQYAIDLPEGWCALVDVRDRLGFGLAFDRRVLSSCWLFATYGGWRNLYTVVLEPCTGYPVSLNEGIRRGTHRVLPAGQSLECEVVAVIFEGMTAVTSITLDGTVIGS